MFRIMITREHKSKFELTIGVFSIAYCDVGDWEIDGILEYADGKIRTAL